MGTHATDRRLELIPLIAAGERAPAEVGHKAKNLGRLLGRGLAVPAGVVIPVALWEEHAREAGLANPLAQLEDALGAGERERAASLGRELQERCRAAPLSAGLEQALADAVRSLGDRLAVRSSAAGEDEAGRSAAGQYESWLDVSPGALSDTVRACWAAQFAPPVLAYRLDRPRSGAAGPDGLAVLIQRSLPAEAAGVAFSQPDSRGFLVEAVPGSGEALVDGRRDPIRFGLSPEGEVQAMDGGDPLGLLDASVPISLAQAATEAEALLGPADLEWVQSERRLFLVQARPITRAALPGGQGRVRWTAANSQEALLEPVTPLTWSFLLPLVERGRRALFRLGGFAEQEGEYLRLFYGLPYFNPDYFRCFLAQIPGAPANIFDSLIFGEGPPGIAFDVPQLNPKTVRLGVLYLVGRLFARERFELYRRGFLRRLDRLAQRDLTRLSDEALLAQLKRAGQLLEGALRRHVLGTAISGAGYLLLDLFLQQTGANSAFPEHLVARLSAGAWGSALADSAVRLEELASAAAARPALRERLLALKPGEWRTLAEGPAAAAGGRWLVQELERFLTRYGHRCEQEAELSEPRWADAPAALVAVLQSSVRAQAAEGAQPGQAGQRQRLRTEELDREAAALTAQVDAYLKRRFPWERALPARRLLFRALLREARRYAPYRENLKDCGLRAIHLVRRLDLEAGRRLVVAGQLSGPEDVFFLEQEELTTALAGHAPPAGVLARRVAERRTEREDLKRLAKPRYVIEVPGEPPRPVFAAPIVPGVGHALLEGVGVSGGKITGRARVLERMDQDVTFEQGEILVARVVNAGWTPLFHLAGGVVAEVGGVLSHAAIVTREYGIPAVFGAAGASAVPDGARITVDGDLGIVTLEEDAEPGA